MASSKRNARNTNAALKNKATVSRSSAMPNVYVVGYRTPIVFGGYHISENLIIRRLKDEYVEMTNVAREFLAHAQKEGLTSTDYPHGTDAWTLLFSQENGIPLNLHYHADCSMVTYELSGH
jgi:hypothetical protein